MLCPYPLGVGIGVYVVFKYRLRAIRKFIDSVDDALYDDKVSELEFRAIWANGKAVIAKEKK